MAVSFSEEDIQAKARELGLIGESEELPRHLRSRVAAALLSAQPRKAGAEVPVAKSIAIEPGGRIEVDGRPFPWLVSRDRIETTINPDGLSAVRLTLLAESVQVLKPVPESENRA